MKIATKIQSQISLNDEKALYVEHKILNELIEDMKVESFVNQDGEGVVKITTKSATKTFPI